MPNIGQVSYSLYPPQAEPGMLADAGVNRIISLPAAETIQPGRLVEMAADGLSVQQVQHTGSTLNAIGFSVLMTAREGLGAVNVTANTGGAYQPGDMVAVLRRGAIFAEWKGTTQSAYGKPNVYHSSTLAADRGKLTDAITSTVAGSEIAACPSWVQLREALSGSGNVALVEVNAPGAA